MRPDVIEDETIISEMSDGDTDDDGIDFAEGWLICIFKVELVIISAAGYLRQIAFFKKKT